MKPKHKCTKAAALTFGLFLILNWPIPSAGKPVQKPQERAASSAQKPQNNQQPPQPNLPPTTPVLNPNTAPQCNEKTTYIRNEESDKTSPDWVARFSGALAVVAFLQLIILLWQILSTGSTTRKELRAYLLPDSGSRRMKDGKLKLELVFKNSGKTPALNCVTRYMDGVAAVNNTDFPMADDPTARRSRSFIGSNTPLYVFEDAYIPTPEELATIQNGTHAVYVAGDITYEDVFGYQHTARFRLVSEGTNFNAGLFVFCDEGNEIT